MIYKTRQKIFLTVLAMIIMSVVSTGCGGVEDRPSLIGSHPAEDHGEVYYHPPEVRLIIYEAILELDVSSVSRAYDRIADLAHAHGGYVTYANIWHKGRTENATVEVIVPVVHYHDLYDRILRLGTLQSEVVSGEIQDLVTRERGDKMTTITVHLSEQTRIFSRRSSSGHSANTFWHAFEVASTLFRFLFDALIWVLVVAGPFVLIWLGIRTIWRWVKHPSKDKHEKES